MQYTTDSQPIHKHFGNYRPRSSEARRRRCLARRLFPAPWPTRLPRCLLASIARRFTFSVLACCWLRWGAENIPESRNPFWNKSLIPNDCIVRIADKNLGLVVLKRDFVELSEEKFLETTPQFTLVNPQEYDKFTQSICARSRDLSLNINNPPAK